MVQLHQFSDEMSDSQKPTLLGGGQIFHAGTTADMTERPLIYGVTIKSAQGKEYGWMRRDLFDDLKKIGDIAPDVEYPKEWQDFADGKNQLPGKAVKSSQGRFVSLFQKLFRAA